VCDRHTVCGSRDESEFPLCPSSDTEDPPPYPRCYLYSPPLFFFLYEYITYYLNRQGGPQVAITEQCFGTLMRVRGTPPRVCIHTHPGRFTGLGRRCATPKGGPPVYSTRAILPLYGACSRFMLGHGPVDLLRNERACGGEWLRPSPSDPIEDDLYPNQKRLQFNVHRLHTGRGASVSAMLKRSHMPCVPPACSL